MFDLRVRPYFYCVLAAHIKRMAELSDCAEYLHEKELKGEGVQWLGADGGEYLFVPSVVWHDKWLMLPEKLTVLANNAGLSVSYSATHDGLFMTFHHVLRPVVDEYIHKLQIPKSMKLQTYMDLASRLMRQWLVEDMKAWLFANEEGRRDPGPEQTLERRQSSGLHSQLLFRSAR